MDLFVALEELELELELEAELELELFSAAWGLEVELALELPGFGLEDELELELECDLSASVDSGKALFARTGVKVDSSFTRGRVASCSASLQLNYKNNLYIDPTK